MEAQDRKLASNYLFLNYFVCVCVCVCVCVQAQTGHHTKVTLVATKIDSVQTKHAIWIKIIHIAVNHIISML